MPTGENPPEMHDVPEASVRVSLCEHFPQLLSTIEMELGTCRGDKHVDDFAVGGP